MMLRTLVLVAAMILLTIGVVATALDLASWPMVAGPLVLVIGIVFERARYGASRPRPQENGWVETPERFIDDASGRAMSVWYKPATGERRYTDMDSPSSS